MGHRRPLLLFIFGLFKQIFQFLQYMWKNINPVSSAEIQTHDLLDVSHPLRTTKPGLPPNSC